MLVVDEFAVECGLFLGRWSCSTLPCVATLYGPCLAALGPPLDRAVRSSLIICDHCCLPFTDAGTSFFIFSNELAVSSTVRSSLEMVDIRQCCGYM